MRLMRGLDFIIGGIPRGGTTAFADALNQHPEVFCYASETNLLPLAQQIGCGGPVPSKSIPHVRRWLYDELCDTMIDMVQWNLENGSPTPPFCYKRNDINRIVSAIFDRQRPSKDGQALTDIASAELACDFRERSGKIFVGEKTPSNVFALEATSSARFDAKGVAPVFVVVRRPFPVIFSMRSRLTNKADRYASIFSGDAAQQAGLYIRYALACARLARRGAHLLRYEAFAGNAREVLPKVLSAIGASVDGRSIDAINRQIAYLNRKDIRNRFSSVEQATIDALTESVLIPLGYGRDPHSRSAEVDFELGHRVLSGEYEDKMLGPRAVVMLVAQAQHHYANLRFWHSFPGTIADGSDTVCWRAEAMDGYPLGSGAALGGGPSIVDLSVELDPSRGTRCANGNIMYLVEVACSHSFVPLVHPFRLHPFSPDLRQISGQIVSVEFS